jgi:hypothetical protein
MILTKKKKKNNYISIGKNFFLLEENHENPFHNNQYENILVQNVVYLHPLYVHKVELDLTE